MASYIHLGGIVDASMSMKSEVRRRLVLAQASFDEGKKLLYTNLSIPLMTRSTLFQTTVLATMFNLGLWIPTGDGWQQLSGGFTRILRGLLTKHYKGDLLYNLAAPAVHILTACPPLEMFARRARISLLVSVCKAGPDELWAALQAEQGWLEVVRDDLQWLCADDPLWPPLGPLTWPALLAIFKDRTDWVKRKVRTKLKRDFEAFCEEQMQNLMQWALYRRLQQAFPSTCSAGSWCCRPCGVRVRTKAAVGAHFFKVHGRRAKHRKFVQGTVCRGCGRQYWTQAKLATHLLDHPRCVEKLQAHGLAAATMAPGRGSKLWRKAADEDCNLAVPEPCLQPLPDAVASSWDDELWSAHSSLCYELLEPGLPAEREALTAKISEELARHPLFPEEEDEVVAHVAEELQELRRADSAEHWSDQVFESLCAAVGSYSCRVEPPELLVEAQRQSSDSLQAFSAKLSAFNWADALNIAKRPHVTPDSVLFSLDSREVACSVPERHLM